MVCVSFLDEEDKHQDFVYALKDHYLMYDTEDFPGLSGETVPFSPSRHFEDMDYEFDPYSFNDSFQYSYGEPQSYEDMEFWSNINPPQTSTYNHLISDPFSIPNSPQTPSYSPNPNFSPMGFPNSFQAGTSVQNNFQPPNTPQAHPPEDRHTNPQPPPEISPKPPVSHN
jgi:hypothetical protein